MPFLKRWQTKILDVGCGQGAATLFLAKEGFDVTAIDGSQSALAKLKDRLAAEMLSANVRQSDADNTKLPDASFDGVVDIVCMAHNHNTREIAKEMHRVLKPDGKIFSVVPITDCNQDPYKGKGHVEFMTIEDINNTFRGLFTITVGWVRESLGNGRLLSHWVITGTKFEGVKE